METTELRIGNLIDYCQGREPIRVTGKDLADGIEGRPFRPIPLTEEWLQKADIEQQAMNRFLVKKLGGHLDCAYDLKYVHQLQNLYFAQLGFELEII